MRDRLTPPPAHRLAKYGITQDDWLDLYRRQGGKCFICRKTFTPGRRPCVDHNHRTGHVRGLLCGTCNALLGGLNEDIAWLRNAAEYLSIPPAESVFDEPRIHTDRQETE